MSYAVPCENGCVTGVAAGHYAVEQVDSPCHRLNNVGRRSDTHQIAYLIFRHYWLNNVYNVIHNIGRFTDGKSTDSIAVQIKLCYLLHMRGTKVVVSTALIYSEKQLLLVNGIVQGVQTLHFVLAAVKPSYGTFTGTLCVIMLCGIFHTFIERHSNGRAKV